MTKVGSLIIPLLDRRIEITCNENTNRDSEIPRPFLAGFIEFSLRSLGTCSQRHDLPRTAARGFDLLMEMRVSAPMRNARTTSWTYSQHLMAREAMLEGQEERGGAEMLGGGGNVMLTY